MCAKSHPGRCCFEAAVAQSRSDLMACAGTLSEDAPSVFTACLWFPMVVYVA